MKLQKIGMRNIKTSISVSMALLLGELGYVENPLITSAACLDTVKDTVKDSLDTGLYKMFGTVLGGIVGFLLVYYNLDNFIFGALGISFIIHLCNMLNIQNAIIVTSVTYLAIILGVGDNDPFQYSILRTWDTAIGILIAVIINSMISRRKYVRSLSRQYISIKKDFIKDVEKKVFNFDSVNISEIEEHIVELENVYDRLYLENKYIVDTKNVESYKISMEICKRIYSHILAIDVMEQKEYVVSSEVASLLSSYYNKNGIEYEQVDVSHGVFDYHIRMILEESLKLREIQLKLI